MTMQHFLGGEPRLVWGDGGSLILPQGLGRSWDPILGPRLAARIDAGVWMAIPEGMTLDGARELMSYGIPLRTRLREQAARLSVC